MCYPSFNSLLWIKTSPPLTNYLGVTGTALSQSLTEHSVSPWQALAPPQLQVTTVCPRVLCLDPFTAPPIHSSLVRSSASRSLLPFLC